MNWNDAITYITPILTAAATLLVLVRKTQLQHQKTQVDLWRELASELKADLSSRNTELTEVKAQLATLVMLSNEQTRQIQHLEEVVERQSKKIAELKSSIK